jgi:hypothetical protein
MPICIYPKDVHKAITLKETKEVIEAYCVKCKAHKFFRKDAQGRLDPEYAKFFRADTLQPSMNLYYKVYKNRMAIDKT